MYMYICNILISRSRSSTVGDLVRDERAWERFIRQQRLADSVTVRCNLLQWLWGSNDEQTLGIIMSFGQINLCIFLLQKDTRI